MSESLPILDITQEFFSSPMWKDTIKDFVLANCNIFTGDEEYSIEHFNCHKRFVKVIEDTLNIYLLDIIGINFEIFQDACLAACHNPDSIAAEVIHVLKQATDFRYFAAKMYAYNVMLDREAASSFLIEGDTDNAFFVTDGAVKQEIEIQSQESKVAISQMNQIEEELGLKPTVPEQILQPAAAEQATQPKEEEEKQPEEKPLPPKKSPPQKLPPMEDLPKNEEPPKEQPQSLAATDIPKFTEAQRNEMKRKIMKEREALNRTIDPDELAKRKEAFEKRRQQLVDQKRTEIKEQIDLNLKKHEKPVVVPEEDPMDAIRRALAGRVKDLIDEDA